MSKKRKRYNSKLKDLEETDIHNNEVNGNPKIKIEIEDNIKEFKPDHNISYHEFTKDELLNIRRSLLNWYDKVCFLKSI